MKNRMGALEEALRETGVKVYTYSPGGPVRYRFVLDPKGKYNYFSATGADVLITVYGFKDAMTYALGLSAGYNLGLMDVLEQGE